MSQNERKSGRDPIGDRPMTPAERKRRSREAKRKGESLESETARIVKQFAEETGFSDRYARYIIDVIDYGVPEWIDYYRRHGEEEEYLSLRKAAIAARKLDESQQRAMLRMLEERGYRFTHALYAELWASAPGSNRDKRSRP
jgi:hypothetical protein